MTRDHRLMKGRQRRQGSAAIEFALVALPFFALMIGLLEVGVILLMGAMIETATSDVSRLVRTGQAQMQDLTEADLKARFCSKLIVFNQDCSDRSYVDIRVVEGFSGNIAPDPMADGTFNPDVLTYEPGVPGDYVLVRVWIEHPVMTPFMSQLLSRTSNHKVLMRTTLAFRNEPYL